MTGRIEAIEGDHLIINGIKVILTNATDLQGAVTRGAFAAAIGELQKDGTVVAHSLRTRAPDRDANEDEEEPDETPTPEDGSQQERPVRITIAGILEFLDGDHWRVGDRAIVISTDTRIEGGLITPGASVRVEGVIARDGTIIVSRIRVLGPLILHPRRRRKLKKNPTIPLRQRRSGPQQRQLFCLSSLLSGSLPPILSSQRPFHSRMTSTA
ncbi:MAG: hypothetical protein FJ312_07020 [SAR202 cluster bacterium]|nr:hypothetical protein [SAR202 cluster bacterium]